jgi:hypothetical protein
VAGDWKEGIKREEAVVCRDTTAMEGKCSDCGDIGNALTFWKVPWTQRILKITSHTVTKCNLTKPKHT